MENKYSFEERRQGRSPRNLLVTAIALCLPILAALLLSSSIKLKTLQPAEILNVSSAFADKYVPQNVALTTETETGTPQATGTAQTTSTAQGTGTAQTTSTPDPNVVNVYAMSHDVFSPADVTISVGTTVRWTNADDEDHTTTSDTGVWNSGALHPGQWFEFTFLEPGDYHYTCLIHGAQMQGTIHVTDNSSTPTPGGATSTPTSTPGAGTVDVSIQNFAFQPHNVTILVGTTVRWTNLDPGTHTTTSDTGLWNSGDLTTNAQFSYTFNAPGTYDYHCERHPGMTGTITVVSSLPTGTPQSTGTAQATSTSQPSTTVTAEVTGTPQTTSTVQPTGTSQATGTVQTTGTAQTTGTVQTTATSQATGTAVGGYSDVQPDNTFYLYIMCLTNRGIMSGYPDGTFRPNNPVTRGQLSKIVSNAAGLSEPVIGQMFEDVVPGSTFYLYIERMILHGVISGYPCGGNGEPCGPDNKPYFRPNASATRGQIAKIVSNAAGYNDIPAGQTFEDVAPGSTFYLWIERLAARGAMRGYQCGGNGEPCGPDNKPYFRPGNNATRGQTSKIVANTFFPTCTP